DVEEAVRSSVAYMAPEQVAGEVPGPAADIYGLALLTYEMLSGHRPPLGSQPPPLESVPRDVATELDTVIARATHPDPTARYPRVDDLLRALRQVFGADVVTRARPETSEVRN